jgi:hypothetical protein
VEQECGSALITKAFGNRSGSGKPLPVMRHHDRLCMRSIVRRLVSLPFWEGRWTRCGNVCVNTLSRGPCRCPTLFLRPLNSLLWYVPSSRYIWSSAPIFLFLQEQIKDIIISV